MLRGDQGTHLRVRIRAVPHDEPGHSIADGVQQRVGDVAYCHKHRYSHAPLPRRAECGRHRGIGGDVQVGVRQHDHVVLGARQGLHAFPVPGAGFVHVLRDRSRADERNSLHVGMLKQSIDGHLVPLQDIEHTVGEARLVKEFGQQKRRRRIALRWLQHKGVARGDGIGNGPQGHHGREVERRDARHHAERLTYRVDVDAARRALVVRTLQQFGDPAGEFDVFQTAPHFPGRVAQDLAMLSREGSREFVDVGLHQIPKAEHEFGPG